jgi:2-polyprenyl-3-methyl-5-hydroxy-6-metoxy-1,4-benzoquinol methylase
LELRYGHPSRELRTLNREANLNTNRERRSVKDKVSPDHYSYTVYADPETARTFDDRRFGGPIGELVAETQAAVLIRMAGDIRGRLVLDVGTGTGRAALLLAQSGAEVTGVDASEPMLAVARERARAAGRTITFVHRDAHALEFPDRSFEVAISLRMLMHSPRWRDALSELCRVATRRVIVDYPSSRSAARLQSISRRIASRLGATTEPYRVFADGDITAALGAFGFEVRELHRQFVLPIALHKAIGSRTLTTTVEALLERAGLLRVFGSPVTVIAERAERAERA